MYSAKVTEGDILCIKNISLLTSIISAVVIEKNVNPVHNKNQS